jgi:hypothetical protein
MLSLATLIKEKWRRKIVIIIEKEETKKNPN